MLVSWVIEWSKCRIPHWRTFGNFTHWASVIWDLSNHDLFRIISDPGSQQSVTMSLKSICTIPFQVRASNVKMRKLKQHSSNQSLPCIVIVFGTFRGTRDQSNENPAARCRSPGDILSNITNRDIRWPGMMVVKTLVNWVLSDAHVIGKIVSASRSWSCVSHHQSPMFISLQIQLTSQSARSTSSISRCAWHGRCARRNSIHFKIALKYNSSQICQSSSIQPYSPSPKSRCERSFRSTSAYGNDSILMLSSWWLRYWSIFIFISLFNDWAC